MNDQASTLRLIVSNKNTESSGMINSESTSTAKRMQSIAISGGKGGVGKSNLAVNLALELGAAGQDTILLDADLGLANADLICGVTPEFHLGHLVAGWKSLEDIAIFLSSNVRLIPGGSGVAKLANMSLKDDTSVLSEIKALESSINYFLIDTAAGVAENVMCVIDAADRVIIVATPEPTSIVDAYATIKVVENRTPGKEILIIVNQVVGIGDAEEVFTQIQQVVRQFLDRNVSFLGMVPQDEVLVEAVKNQMPIVKHSPQSPASRAIRLIAKSLHSNEPPSNSPDGPAQSFWDRLTNQTQ